MTKRTFIIIGILLLAGAVAAELFYFRFHTYFQSTVVNEAIPSEIKEGTPAESKVPVLVSGSFVAVDTVHKGSGTAKIILQGDKQYLRLENFQVTNGPDLYVYLSESRTPGSDLKSLDKYISLGRLKGNVGDQNYEIPEIFDGYYTAVIWCQKFGVLLSYALME